MVSDERTIPLQGCNGKLQSPMSICADSTLCLNAFHLRIACRLALQLSLARYACAANLDGLGHIPPAHRHGKASQARWRSWSRAETAMTLNGREAHALRARLLEFLKFRVLAAQDSFFEADCDADALRRWLAGVWPQACGLSDADLLLTWEQARQLYTEEPRRGGP